MASSAGEPLGPAGEKAAARFLKRRGCRILRRNCRAKYGEVDLIVRDGEAVVFVEVKTRRSRTWGDPQDAVNPVKQRKLCLTAAAFAEKHGLQHRPLRFDVVTVVLGEEGPPEIEHFRDAFPLPPGIGV